MTEIANTV